MSLNRRKIGIIGCGNVGATIAYTLMMRTACSELVLIDVNTEKAMEGKRDKEKTFFKINKEAALEAACQMRLRNLSGIILIDFIDMEDKNHIDELLELLRQEVAKDSVPTKVIDMTALGLVELTRKKVRKPLHEWMKG